MHMGRHSIKYVLSSGRYLVRTFAYWIAVFAAFRLIFLLVNFSAFSNLKLPAQGMFEALPLDFSMAAWFCLLSWMLLLAGTLLPLSMLALHRILITGLTLLYGLIAVGEAAAYSEWKSKLNFKVLSVLTHPSELLAIAPLSDVILMSLLWLLPVAAATAFFYPRMVEPAFTNPWIKGRRQLGQQVAAFALTLTLFVPLAGLARGSVGSIPISMSRVYFTSHQAANDLAVNPGWNMFFQIVNFSSVFAKGNPFEFMPLADAQQIVRQMYGNVALRDREPPQKIIDHPKPNIVLLILESWSGDMISSIQKSSEEFTPEFHELEKSGVLFTAFQANGNRSQQGITSILTGFPALGLIAAADDLGFISRLPGLGHRLTKSGYSSAFVYGGQLEYGNIKAVVGSGGFQRIHSGESNFPGHLRRGAMGVHDGEIIDDVISEGDRLQEPFFLTQFTLSSHSPYDFPGAEKITKTHRMEEPYSNSIRYTDEALGKFFARARTRPWFKNTLFVLVSDHGHNTWRDLPIWHPEYRRIPLLLTGPVIKNEFRGSRRSTIGSQIDIPATLLGQLDEPRDDFEWSNDLFSKNQNRFAHYELNYGFGFITTDGAVVYDKAADKTIFATLPDKKVADAILTGKAYTQCSMQTFIDGTWCGVKNTLGANN
jgi:phosphoglycerol transferase MdoB-like AlkP superfamily enzyme